MNEEQRIALVHWQQRYARWQDEWRGLEEAIAVSSQTSMWVNPELLKPPAMDAHLAAALVAELESLSVSAPQPASATPCPACHSAPCTCHFLLTLKEASARMEAFNTSLRDALPTFRDAMAKSVDEAILRIMRDHATLGKVEHAARQNRAIESMVKIAKARTRERYPDACQTCECVPCACGGEESQTPAARTGNRAGDLTNLNEDRQRLGLVPFCAKCNSAPCCCHIIAARDAEQEKEGTCHE